MKRPDNPCFGCEDRWVNEVTTCHATCTRYAKFQQQNRAFNDKMHVKGIADYGGGKWYQTCTGWWRKK